MGIITKEIREAGARKLRETALRTYYDNPNYCENCGVIILVRSKEKVCDVKIKRFCSKSCAAITNNKRFPKKSGNYVCRTCGQKIKSGRLYCEICLKPAMSQRAKNGTKKRIINQGLQDWSNINQMTKQEVLEKSGGHSWTMKCTITRYARRTYRNAGKPNICQACGYDKHINVCHIKDVSDFPMEALIGEINHLDNLVGLCPNHHWEFDHGQLDLN